MLDLLLQTDENPLQEHYSDFNVAQRILLSGHSHQAWPNVALDGQILAYRDAAKFIDDKWAAAFEKADQVRSFYGKLIGQPDAEIALAGSTHDLLLRFLSCLPFRAKKRPKIITTTGEFHAMRRQLTRLGEEGVTIQQIEVQPLASLDQRLSQAIDQDTVAMMVSGVFFESGQIFSKVGNVAVAAAEQQIPCLVDLYHVLNIVPFDIQSWHLQSAFLVGGGYKYLQAGEGNCFMRIPPFPNAQSDLSTTTQSASNPSASNPSASNPSASNPFASNPSASNQEPIKPSSWRPLITGWFAEFAILDQLRSNQSVAYGPGHAAFAGSTYDPTSHYRAAAVFEFFEQQQLTAVRLRNINQQQLKMLYDGITSLKISPNTLALPSHSLEELGGFLPLRTAQASLWVKHLKEHGVSSDSRGEYLRLGPAPYVSKKQIHQAIDIIGNIATKI